MTSLIPARDLTRSELQSLGNNVSDPSSLDPDDFDHAAIERSLSLHELFGIADPRKFIAPRKPIRRNRRRRRVINVD